MRAALVAAVAVTIATAGAASATGAGAGTPTGTKGAKKGTTERGAHGTRVMRVSGQFVEPGLFRHPRALTYDERVPQGAEIQVGQRVTDGHMEIAIAVHGVEPHYTYGAHVHSRPCGDKPLDSGPHYQNRKDPHQPSVDPRYANPRNEVWLDFTTDRNGDGSAVSRHAWVFRHGGPRSVVLHEHSTSSRHGHAGEAGSRLACITVPFLSGPSHHRHKHGHGHRPGSGWDVKPAPATGADFGWVATRPARQR